MRVLVCGDRDWSNVQLMHDVLSRITPAITVLIEGEARGADKMARQWATAMGIEVKPFPALWDKYGTRAGPIRNMHMLERGNPHLVLAFHDDIRKSKGTKDMVKQALRKGLNVYLYPEKGIAHVFLSPDAFKQFLNPGQGFF